MSVRLLAVAALLWASLGIATSANEADAVSITVREERGIYRVSAVFSTPHSVAAARAVLTDYEQIPRFMPDVESSRVLERGDGRALVEQEAVAKVLFFSKRVHLVLDIREEASSLHFHDRSGRSFVCYEGAWILREHAGGAAITYELAAQPAFDVPEFLLTRLLRRDASRMIERLLAEIAARQAGVTRRAGAG